MTKERSHETIEHNTIEDIKNNMDVKNDNRKEKQNLEEEERKKAKGGYIHRDVVRYAVAPMIPESYLTHESYVKVLIRLFLKTIHHRPSHDDDSAKSCHLIFLHLSLYLRVFLPSSVFRQRFARHTYAVASKPFHHTHARGLFYVVLAHMRA